MIISIDGLAATGKSTTAKAVANQLNFSYLDTGAMYRAVTFAIIKSNVNINDNKQIEDLLKSLKIEFVNNSKCNSTIHSPSI